MKETKSATVTTPVNATFGYLNATLDTVNYLPQFELNHNAAILAQQMRDFRRISKSDGYRFIFSDLEWSTHATARSGFSTDCFDMMRAARDDRKSVRIFRNMNGELTAQLN